MQIRKNFFTMFELLISVGLLVILSVVLLRTFQLTADYWKFSAEQSDTYIDAKIIMTRLNDDISNMLYEMAPESVDKKISVPLYTGSFTVSYTAIKPLNSDGSEGTARGWCVGLVTRVPVTEENPSGISKVAYIYYPPAAQGSSVPISNSTVTGKDHGVLMRGTVTETTANYLNGGQTMQNFYQGAMASATQIADGILDFKVQAYSLSGTTFTAKNYNSSTHNIKGMDDVSALRLTMTMMPVDKLEEYRQLLNKSGVTSEEKHDFIHKHGRKFSRTFWVNALTQ